MKTPSPNCLLYLVHGAEYFHHEVFFSIVSALSFLRHEAETPEKPEIRVVTDRPDLYAALPVCIDALDAQTRAEWAGVFAFHWRMRYPCIRTMLQQHERVVLIDGDTFFTKSPSHLFFRIMPGHLLCHRIEGKLGASDGASSELFRQLENADLTHDRNARLFNAGVIGINRVDEGFLEAPLALLDRFYPDLGKIYIFEQICISVAAHKRLRLNTCADTLVHYWSRKTIIRAKIQHWFKKYRDAPCSESAFSDLAQIDARLPRPALFARFKIKLALPLFPKIMRQFAKDILYSTAPPAGANEFDLAASRAYQKKAIENALAKNGRSCVMDWLERPLLRKMAGTNFSVLRKMLNSG
jgi:hypothetical protein